MPTARSSEDELAGRKRPAFCSIVSSETHVPLSCAASFPKPIFARTADNFCGCSHAPPMIVTRLTMTITAASVECAN